MIKTLINTYLTRKDQQRTIELLDAASKGDDEVSRRRFHACVAFHKLAGTSSRSESCSC